MPSHFDRFRLLNDGGHRRIRNESFKSIYVRAEEGDEPIVVPPGEELPLPESPAGETILDVENEGA